VTVLVTGARGGIGAAIVDAFLARGADALAHDLRPVAGGERAGVRHLAGDLLDDAHLGTLADELAAHPPRHVVAAHGIAPACLLRDLGADELEHVMEVDFVSVVRLYGIVAPALERVGGSFTAIASQAGLRGESAMGAYCAAKFALAGWAQAVGRAGGVRVRVICPGVVDTPLLQQAFTDVAATEGIDAQTVKARRVADVPLGRLATPREIADAVVWLSDLEAAAPLVGAIAGGETFR
jgi:NAD(P)-dependent dehydrogenase (short-subunit alcohol dehydrogenase family)